jgi:hypothetical protein
MIRADDIACSRDGRQLAPLCTLLHIPFILPLNLTLALCYRMDASPLLHRVLTQLSHLSFQYFEEDPLRELQLHKPDVCSRVYMVKSAKLSPAGCLRINGPWAQESGARSCTYSPDHFLHLPPVSARIMLVRNAFFLSRVTRDRSPYGMRKNKFDSYHSQYYMADV